MNQHLSAVLRRHDLRKQIPGGRVLPSTGFARSGRSIQSRSEPAHKVGGFGKLVDGLEIDDRLLREFSEAGIQRQRSELLLMRHGG
jgi:hypothetical protein